MLHGILGLILAITPVDDLQHAVARSVQQGVSYARAHAELVDAEDADFPGGAAGLLLYTLSQCGVPKEDAVCQELVQKTLETIEGETRTRALAHSILGLVATDAEAHRETLDAAVDRLSGAARVAGPDAGGFGKLVFSPDPAKDLTDRMSTPLALFALRMASDHGVPIDRSVLIGAIEYLARVQNRDGGFGHAKTERPESRLIPSGGSAAAAIFIAELLPMDDEGRRVRELASKVAHRAVKSLGDSLTLPPRNADDRPGLALARLERLSWYIPNQAYGGSDEWQRDAARWLVSEQLPDGGFGDPNENRAKAGSGSGGVGMQAKKSRARPRAEATLARTCYALLFLAKATAKHGSDHENIIRLTDSFDPNGSREEKERQERRVIAFGKCAMAPLMVLLRRDPERAAFADRCLRRLTGKDMGFGRARTDAERKAAVDRWIDLYVGRG